jgi:hypothetical protein
MLEEELPGIASPEELISATDAEVFAAWLSASSLEHQIKRTRRYTTVPDHALDELRGYGWDKLRFVAVGSVREGERTAYVLYREQFPHEGLDPGAEGSYSAASNQEPVGGLPSLAVCRLQDDGSWLLVADYTFPHRANFAFSFAEPEVDENA